MDLEDNEGVLWVDRVGRFVSGRGNLCPKAQKQKWLQGARFCRHVRRTQAGSGEAETCDHYPILQAVGNIALTLQKD